jgi:hypothetical protein
MKKLVTIILIILIPLLAKSQITGGVELNSGGFSYIPAYISRDPNLIFDVNLPLHKRLNVNLITQVDLTIFNVRAVLVDTRYKFLDKRLKAYAGVHLPTFVIDKNYNVSNFVAPLLVSTYSVNDKLNLNGMYLRGFGRNIDFSSHFVSLIGNYVPNKKINFANQVYYLNLDNTVGVAETVVLKIDKHLQLNTFATYNFKNESFITTIGLKYNY